MRSTAWLLAMSNTLASSSRDCAHVSRKLFPAVDFGLFRCGTVSEVSKASRLLRTYGAFRIKNHGLSPRVTADCFQYVRIESLSAVAQITKLIFHRWFRPGNFSMSLLSSRAAPLYILSLMPRKLATKQFRKKVSNFISNRMLL